MDKPNLNERWHFGTVKSSFLVSNVAEMDKLDFSCHKFLFVFCIWSVLGKGPLFFGDSVREEED